jgi:hypothetical protein
LTTIAAIVVCLAEDDPLPLLSTLGFADEVHLITESADANSVWDKRCNAHVRARPTCIEEIGSLLLTLSDSDWILLVDPDERVHANDSGLRDALDRAAPDVAAFDVAYTLSIFGSALDATFQGLRKTKLVRAGRCSWPFELHALPRPTDPDGRIEILDRTVISIASDLADDLPTRLARHAHWARIEARDRGSPVGVDALLRTLTDPLIEYLGARGGADDGIAGLANALLHVAKEIQRALFETSHCGLGEMNQTDHRRLISLLDAVRDL